MLIEREKIGRSTVGEKWGKTGINKKKQMRDVRYAQDTNEQLIEIGESDNKNGNLIDMAYMEM